MVWAIVVVAIAVLGAAAWAGTGRLGEMPEPVTDRPKAHIPDGPVDQGFLDTVSLPLASTGYRCSQVDEVLASHVAGGTLELDHRFDVVRRGYDMQAVDMILDRLRPADVDAKFQRDGDAANTAEELHDGSAATEPAPGGAHTTTPGDGDAEAVDDTALVPDSAPETHDSLHREGVEEGDRGELAAP